jgi:hypothetical protein
MVVSAVPLRSQFRFLHRVEACTGRTQRVGGPGAASVVRLSKTEDYLADNLYVPMLSEVMHWVQEESGWRWEAVPELGIGGKALPKRKTWTVRPSGMRWTR